MIKVSAIVLSLNEEERIKECLVKLKPYLDWILVLDGNSSDRTVEIAKLYADKVEVKPSSGSFAEERNYAQNLAPTEWVLHVDCDEVFPVEFLHNIRKIITYRNADAYRLPRNNLLRGEEAFPDYQVRLLDKNRVE